VPQGSRSTAKAAGALIPIFRVLCAARIINTPEGAAEIQAQVIARISLGGRN